MSQYVPPHLRNRSVPTPSVSGPPIRHSTSTTMASLTRTTPNVVHSSASAPSVSEFPNLSSSISVPSTKPSVWSNNTKSFAELARNWGVEQKEKEEQEKLQAKERLTQAQLQKEKEEKERAFYRVDVLDSTRLIYGSSNEQKKQNEKMIIPYDDDIDMVEDDLSYEDNEEENVELDTDWNYRRNKNDLY